MIVIPSKAQKSVMCFKGDDDGEDIHNLLVKIRQECFSVINISSLFGKPSFENFKLFIKTQRQ